MVRRGFLFLLGAAAAALLAGCGGGGSGGSVDTSVLDQLVQNTYQNYSNAVHIESFDTLDLIVSPSYYNAGVSGTAFFNAWEQIFSEYDNIVMTVTIHNIVYDSQSTPEFATVTYDILVTGTSKATGQQATIDQGNNRTDILRYEDGRFKLYGNQKNTA